MATVRLTMAQAVVRYLTNQFTEIDGARVPLFAGVFGIFGHGNVTCLAEALERVQDQLPTWRGQNEQSMALAAVAYAKAKRRRQIMVATSSIGPGATNMITAAGVAHANRIPMLLIAGDVFANRRPDPVLQQVEHFGNPTVSVNDGYKAVTRYWDRITHPEQIISSLPQAVATMLDPADCGPAFIGLCQDVQEIAFDYPKAFFTPTVHKIPRPRPDLDALSEASKLLKNAKKPLIISGGGVRYSGAEEALGSFAVAHGIPISETVAGRGTLTHNHPNNVGPVGVVGSTSANALAEEADVVIAVGTRLQDFTTGSWTAFAEDAQFLSINAARYDTVKHRAVRVVGDARVCLEELDSALGDWKTDASHMERAQSLYAEWNSIIDETIRPGNVEPMSYAQMIGAVNTLAGDDDLVLTAAGGLPGETAKNWRIKTPGTFDCDYGFSCMGYEIAGAWGAAMADPDRDVFALCGDGSYLMMNSDIYSTVLTGHKIILIVCDNGGYGVINRLQNYKGGKSFNNLIADCNIKEEFRVDFATHAASMGALTRKVESVADLEDAVRWAKTTDRTTVISVTVDAYTWSSGDAWWDVAVPEVSPRAEVQKAREDHMPGRKKQRVGV